MRELDVKEVEAVSGGFELPWVMGLEDYAKNDVHDMDRYGMVAVPSNAMLNDPPPGEFVDVVNRLDGFSSEPEIVVPGIRPSSPSAGGNGFGSSFSMAWTINQIQQLQNAWYCPDPVGFGSFLDYPLMPPAPVDQNADYEHVADIGEAKELVYEQTSGDLYKVNPDGSLTLVARGYSGAAGEARNNPAYSNEVGQGPIPLGTYSVGPPRKYASR